MRNFAICLLILNLLYLAWNLELLPGSQTQEQILVRNPSQQAPQSLVLLSELDELPPALEEPEAKVLNEQAGNNSGAADIYLQDDAEGFLAACMALGSFLDVNESNALALSLRQRGYQANVELSEQTESEYRVYMPPFNSDAAARQTLVSLLASGIDSFIIGDGDLARGISLGVFSQQNSANLLQEQLAAEGYATSIQEIVRSNSEFWVLVHAVSADELESLWLSLADVPSSSNQSENLCQIIAPEG